MHEVQLVTISADWILDSAPSRLWVICSENRFSVTSRGFIYCAILSCLILRNDFYTIHVSSNLPWYICNLKSFQSGVSLYHIKFDCIIHVFVPELAGANFNFSIMQSCVALQLRCIHHDQTSFAITRHWWMIPQLSSEIFNPCINPAIHACRSGWCSSPILVARQTGWFVRCVSRSPWKYWMMTGIPPPIGSTKNLSYRAWICVFPLCSLSITLISMPLTLDALNLARENYLKTEPSCKYRLLWWWKELKTD